MTNMTNHDESPHYRYLIAPESPIHRLQVSSTTIDSLQPHQLSTSPVLVHVVVSFIISQDMIARRSLSTMSSSKSIIQFKAWVNHCIIQTTTLISLTRQLASLSLSLFLSRTQHRSSSRRHISLERSKASHLAGSRRVVS